MAFIENRKIKITTVGLKEETTRGNYIAITDAETYCVQNAALPTVTPNLLELDCSNGTLTPGDDTVLVGDQEVTVTFDIAFPINTLAATPFTNYETFVKPIWEICGFALTDNTTYYTIIPVDASATGMSLSYNVDGWEYQVRGCVASEVKISMITKEAVFMNLTLVGTLEDKLEKTALNAASAYHTVPLICGESSLSIKEGANGYNSMIISSVLAITNKVKPMASVTATKGIAYHYIVDRDSRIVLDCSTFWESANQADDEIYDCFVESTKVEVSILNGSGSEFIQLKGKITAHDGTDSDGALHTNLEVKATGAVADLTITVHETP